ncbi:MAG TPA: TIGR02285 family protein [Magnetospirillaceae bacterium]|nr:TIGR02285 family protein [Magnetospirillaceae bacterium]
MRRIIAAIACFAACPAIAAETVTWLTTDLPPQFIGDGPFAGEGIKDRQLKLIQAEIPNFDHREIKASIGRLWYQMQHEDGVCGLGVLRNPEREKIALFTERPVLVPGFRLIVKTGHLDQFRPFMDGNAVDLEALKSNRRLSGGYVADRAYPPPMLDFVADPDHQNKLERAIGNERLYLLLNSGRLDFVFGLGYEAVYFSAVQNAADPLTALPVKGIETLIKGYTACSDGPLGRAVIARLDALQKEENFWRRWVAPLQRWLEPADYAAALEGTP